jgi:hypothetical protein
MNYETNIKVIEAPFVLGNSKKIESRLKNKNSTLNSRAFSRPKTTNTVIRSRTSEPRIRRKL